MASRTGGGGMMIAVAITGTLALTFLVLNFVLLAQVQKQANNVQLRQNELDDAVRSAERDDRWALLRQQAQDQNQGVVRFLDSRMQQTAQLVTGSSRDSADTVNQRITAAMGEGGGSLLSLVESQRSEIANLERRLEQAEADSEAARSDLQASQDRVGALEDEHRGTVGALRDEIDTYKTDADTYRSELETTKNDMEDRVEEIRADADTNIRALESDISDLESRLAIANDQIRTLRIERSEEGLRPSDEAALVDGRIIGVNSATGEVTIDLGREDRLVLGLSFEVYPGGSSIRPSPSGEYPAGKAAVEVIRIDGTSATCRVIRRTSGNPLLVGDAVANAVYDPNKVYSFAVYGNFDTNNDGIPTRQERADIRNLIAEWNGQVSEDVQGDTDFLVLGARPLLPPQPRPDDPVELIQRYLMLRNEVQKYDDMFAQAEATGIPVLNQNRLYTLTGLRGRR